MKVIVFRPRTFVMLLLLAGTAGVFGACASDQDSTEGTSSTRREAAAMPVDTLQLTPQTFVDKFEVLGTAEPIERVAVSTEIPGRVLAANFEEGDTVRRGQTLYRIDVEVDTAGLDVIQSQLDSARRELARMKSLAAEGLATPQQLEQAETAVENGELSLRQARLGLSRNTVTSPIAGHITRKNVENGEYASPGVPLAEVVVYDTIIVRALLPESEVRFVHPGTTLPVQIPALDLKVDGLIKRVDIIARSPSLTYPVEIHIPNEDLSILPGMSARIQITRQVLDDIILVPREAILEGFNGQEAMIVEGKDGKNRAALRRVKLGPGRENLVVVKEGLTPDDQLVVRGHRGIVEGTLVDILHEDTQLPAIKDRLDSPAAEASHSVREDEQ